MSPLPAAYLKIGLRLINCHHNSIWGIALDRFRADRTDAHLVQIVDSLRSQLADCRPVMIDILGEETARLIEQTPPVVKN